MQKRFSTRDSVCANTRICANSRTPCVSRVEERERENYDEFERISCLRVGGIYYISKSRRSCLSKSFRVPSCENHGKDLTKNGHKKQFDIADSLPIQNRRLISFTAALTAEFMCQVLKYLVLFPLLAYAISTAPFGGR